MGMFRATSAALTLAALAPAAIAVAQPVDQAITGVLTLKLVEHSSATIPESRSPWFPGIGGKGLVGGIVGGSLISSPARDGPAGLLFSPPDTRLTAMPVLHVTGLQPGDRTICIEIRSADGQDYAEGSADIPAGRNYARMIRLDYDPLPKLMAARIAGNAKEAPWRAGELVITARVSPAVGCKKLRTLLPVSLEPAVAPRPTLTLLVNGGGPTATVQAGLDSAPRLGDCRSMNSMSNRMVRGFVTYTHACTVAVPADACGTDVLLRIDRESGARRDRGQPFIVRAPCLR